MLDWPQSLMSTALDLANPQEIAAQADLIVNVASWSSLLDALLAP